MCPSLVVNIVPQSKIILLQFFPPAPLFYSFKGKKTYAMSLSGPTGLVCQVHSNVADSSCDMIWQVCGHNQIENEEYFHWGAKFRESWAPKPNGNPHRWLTSRHESQKKWFERFCRVDWTQESVLRRLRQCEFFQHLILRSVFVDWFFILSSSPLHQVWGTVCCPPKGSCSSWVVVLYVTPP